MVDFLNSHGLVKGKIPAGQICPFIRECDKRNKTCPTSISLKDKDFSCGYAHGHSLRLTKLRINKLT